MRRLVKTSKVTQSRAGAAPGVSTMRTAPVRDQPGHHYYCRGRPIYLKIAHYISVIVQEIRRSRLRDWLSRLSWAPRFWSLS